MRHPIILLLALGPIMVHAQAWDLFPLGQRSYFMNGTGEGEHAVRMEVMDSVRPNGDDETLLFRARLPVANSAGCRDALMENWWWIMPFPDWLQMDSLVRTGDSVLFHAEGVATPLLLLPSAHPGDTWTVASGVTAQFTCTAVEEAQVLGMADSVKTFEVTLSGGSWGSGPVIRTIRLSRSHGLVEFIPFRYLLSHTTSAPPAPILHLFRAENADGGIGHPIPTFDDFFHPEPGDVKFWEERFDSWWIEQPSWTRYHLDSVISVNTYADSIICAISRTTQSSTGTITGPYPIQQRILRSAIGPLVEMPPNWLAASSQHADGPYPAIWTDIEHIITIGPDLNDTLFRVASGSSGGTLDTVGCWAGEASDIGFSMTFDTRAGEIGSSLWQNVNETTWTLLASVIGGVPQGDITLGLRTPEEHSSPLLWPNPAQDHLLVRGLPAGRTIRYEVLDALGAHTAQGSTNNGSIPVMGLAPGAYVLRLSTGDGVLHGRFVKE